LQKKNNSQTFNDALKVVSGVTGSLLHDMIMTPVEMLKQRKQLCSKNIPINKMIRSIIRDEGYKAFYKSFLVQISMSIPFTSTFI